MDRRALLIGSQTGGLQGVHADVELMAATFGAAGFSTRTLIESQAGRSGILAAYRELIEDSVDGDAALVYYSGHGGRFRNPFADQDPDAPPYVQFIVPTDFDAPGGAFPGILAEELALLQRELTIRTPNVTSILDCCHSARMSRDPSLIPKALPRPGGYSWEDIRDVYLHTRDVPGALEIRRDGNPLAVRVVACAPEQSAYELDLPDGSRHGALTATLARALGQAEAARLTWHQLLDVLRPAVMDLVVLQRPEIEGPTDRLLFSTDKREAIGVLPICVEAGTAYVKAATLFGLGVGDRYAVVAAGGDSSEALGIAVVEAFAGDRVRLLLEGIDGAHLPPGAEAHPLQVALGRRPVAVRPAEDPERGRVVRALSSSPHLRIAVSGDIGLLATVELARGAAQLLDAQGEPLSAPVALTDEALRSVDRNVQQLARAAHLRDLPSGTGSAELPGDVTVEYALLEPDGPQLPLDTAGEHLFAGDRLLVRIRNESSEQRYASVFDIGLRGKISLLSESEPSGLSLAPGDEQVLYRTPAGLTGIELYWPEDLSAGGPRPETVITVVTDRPQDLRRLAQPGVVVRGDGPAPSPLQRLLDEVTSGMRDARPPRVDADTVRYRVHRFDFMLHPTGRPNDDEPGFEIDERPDLSLRLIVPRGPVEVPSRVAIRLPRVVIHSNRAVLTSTVRVDALVVTQVDRDDELPYRATTARFDRIRDGDTLPLSNLLVYEGPVRRFIDLAIWVARDDKKGLDLAELFANEMGNEDVKTAAVALAGLAVAAPQAALAVTSVAAVATLLRTGARVLDAAVGKSIGVYRTSLLPHERFGTGDPVGRHPPEGLLRSQDMSFAFEVVAL